MENFFIDDKFYTNMEELKDSYECDDILDSLPDDWSTEANESNLLPIIQYNVESLLEQADEFSETNCDQEYEKIRLAILECCDFEKLNSMIPKLYYGSVRKFTITKKEILES